jgi:DNA-binding MarR family transcriptional regulator
LTIVSAANALWAHASQAAWYECDVSAGRPRVPARFRTIHGTSPWPTLRESPLPTGCDDCLGNPDLALTVLYRCAYALRVTDRSQALGQALQALAASSIRKRNRILSLTSAATLATLERTGPRRLTDLAVNEEIAQPSMTILVNQLVGRGFAERRRDAADGRVVLVTITPAGREYLRNLRRAGAADLTALIDKLPADDAATLHRALPALRLLVEMMSEGPR